MTEASDPFNFEDNILAYGNYKLFFFPEILNSYTYFVVELVQVYIGLIVQIVKDYIWLIVEIIKPRHGTVINEKMVRKTGGDIR